MIQVTSSLTVATTFKINTHKFGCLALTV